MAIVGLGYTEGAGTSVAADRVDGKDYQLLKPVFGLEGVATLVSSTDPLPVTLLASGAVIGHVIIDAGAAEIGLVKNSGTFAVQAAQSGTWNITNISGTISLPTGAATEATLSTLNGKVTACNTGAVVLATGAAVIGAVTQSGTWNIGTVTTVTTVSAVTAITNALPAGTNAIGKLAANSGVDIGDVDVTSVVSGTGATNLGKAEDAAHSSGDTGVYALAVRDDALAAHSGTDGDYESLHTGANGALWVQQANDVVSARMADTAGTEVAVTNFGATASISNYVHAITVFRTDAGTSCAFVNFLDGSGGTILWTMPLPPNGGSTVASPKALFKTTANTALYYDVSAALSTVYISVSGARQA